MASLYHYDVYKTYVRTSDARLDPLETAAQGTDVYLLPANATFVAIPTYAEKEIPQFDSDTETWTIIADYRGVDCWDADGQPVIISEPGDLPTGYTDTEPVPTIDDLRLAREKELLAYRENYVYGGIIINGIPFGTDTTDVMMVKSALDWYPSHWKDKDVRDNVRQLIVESSGVGYLDSTANEEVIAGCKIIIGAPDEFVVDTADTSGHFIYPITGIVPSSTVIQTANGSITISSITGDGTSADSVSFTGTLAVGTYEITNASGIEETELAITSITGDGTTTGSIVFTPAGEAQIGVNHVKHIYVEPYLNWQIKNSEGGFSDIVVTKASLLAIYDVITDFVQDCFDAQITKKTEIYSLTYEELEVYDVTTNWPTNVITVA